MYLIKFFDFLFSLPEGNDPIESKLELSKLQLFPVFGLVAHVNQFLVNNSIFLISPGFDNKSPKYPFS